MHPWTRPRSRIPDGGPHLPSCWVRRAVGLEVEVQPEASLHRASVQPVEGPVCSMDRSAVRALLALSDWAGPEGHGLKAATLRDWIDGDLLFWSRQAPRGPAALTGRPGVWGTGDRDRTVALRRGVWMVPAAENAVAVAPVPFMPRGRDLAGSRLVGARFASLERGREVLGLTFVGSEKTGAALRRIVPRLDGRRTEPALRAELSRFEQELVGWLDRAGLMEHRAGPPAPAAEFEAGWPDARVTWLGHAAVLVQMNDTHLLVDPLFFAHGEPPERTEPVEPFDPRALPRLDGILITHGDNDHLNPQALARLFRDVPVVVPRVGPEPAPYQVDMEGMLRLLGFTNVHPVEDGDALRLKGLHIEVLPFEGEDWGLDLAKQTYRVEGSDGVLFFGADAAAMPDLYDSLGRRERPVDLAFLGISGNAETLVMPPGFGYGNFYAPWIPRARRNEWVQHCAGPEDAADACSRMKPRAAFGYACGGAPFIRTEYSDVGSHRAFAEQVVARGLATRPVDLPLNRSVRLTDLHGPDPVGDRRDPESQGG